MNTEIVLSVTNPQELFWFLTGTPVQIVLSNPQTYSTPVVASLQEHLQLWY